MKPDIFISIGTLIALCSILLTASLVVKTNQIKNNEYTQYAIVFTPQTSQEQMREIIFAADGYLVRNTPLGFILIAASKTPEFKSNIEKSGIVAVLNPIITGSCTSKNKSAFKPEAS